MSPRARLLRIRKGSSVTTLMSRPQFANGSSATPISRLVAKLGARGAAGVGELFGRPIGRISISRKKRLPVMPTFPLMSACSRLPASSRAALARRLRLSSRNSNACSAPSVRPNCGLVSVAKSALPATVSLPPATMPRKDLTCKRLPLKWRSMSSSVMVGMRRRLNLSSGDRTRRSPANCGASIPPVMRKSAEAIPLADVSSGKYFFTTDRSVSGRWTARSML